MYVQGKYRNGAAAAPEARLRKYRGRYAEAESRYGPKANVHAAVEEYCRIAHEAGIQPYELALRCTNTTPHPFPCFNYAHVKASNPRVM